MREGDNPLYDQLYFLLPLNSLPRHIREELDAENLDILLTMLQAWHGKTPSTLSATALAIVQRYFGHEEAFLLTLHNAQHQDKKDTSLRLLNLDNLLEEDGYDAVCSELIALENEDAKVGQLSFIADYWLDFDQEDHAIRVLELANRQGGTFSSNRTLATLYSSRGQHEKAARALEDAGKLAPKDKELWLAIGEVWLGLEHWMRAESAFRYCEEIKAPIEESDWGLCRALIPLGKWEHALRLLRRLQEWNPSKVEYVLMEIEILLEKNPEKSEKRLRELSREDSKIPEVYIMLSDFALREGENANARKHIEKGLHQVGENAFLLAAKSKLTRHLREFEKSLILAEEALELEGENEEILFNHLCALLPINPERAFSLFDKECKEWDPESYVEFSEQLVLYNLWTKYTEIRPRILSESPVIKAMDLLHDLVQGKDISTPDFEDFEWDLQVIENIYQRLPFGIKQKFEAVLDQLFDSLTIP